MHYTKNIENLSCKFSKCCFLSQQNSGAPKMKIAMVMEIARKDDVTVMMDGNLWIAQVHKDGTSLLMTTMLITLI